MQTTTPLPRCTYALAQLSFRPRYSSGVHACTRNGTGLRCLFVPVHSKLSIFFFFTKTLNSNTAIAAAFASVQHCNYTTLLGVSPRSAGVCTPHSYSNACLTRVLSPLYCTANTPATSNSNAFSAAVPPQQRKALLAATSTRSSSNSSSRRMQRHPTS